LKRVALRCNVVTSKREPCAQHVRGHRVGKMFGQQRKRPLPKVGLGRLLFAQRYARLHQQKFYPRANRLLQVG
jgi:hypothetical protein